MQSLKHLIAKTIGQVPLRTVIIVPFVLQIVGAVGVVGYLSFKNGQHAVNDLANQLLTRASDQVVHYLTDLLNTPQVINRLNLDAIELGQLNLKNFQTTGRLFCKQMQIFQEVGYVNYANAQGEFIGVERLDNGTLLINETLKPNLNQMSVYATDAQGQRTRQLEVLTDESPIQQEGWYADAAKARKSVWSQIYQWSDKPEVLSISASYPVFDRQQTLVGVIGVDLILTQVGDLLRELRISPSSRVFIIERNGLLIASSSDEKLLTRVKGGAQRLSVLNSRDRLIQATAQHLQRSYGDFRKLYQVRELSFELNRKRQFVQTIPWRDQMGLDWLVVIAVPESDFMAQIHENNRTTFLLCLAALAVAILVGMITARWMTHPIQRLNVAAKNLAEGQWDQEIQLERSDEVGELATSFNQMAQQLHESFATLEQRVAERTAELARAKEAAEAANQAKSTFLANMSHELRTPLNAILGFAQILLHSPTPPDDYHEDLQLIQRSGEHLLTLINDVLDMSKVEAGRVTFNPVNFDLHALLNDLKEIFALRADHKGLQLLLEPQPNVPQYVRTDQLKLRQILINLLGNAIKFTQEGGVSLRVRAIDPFSEANFSQTQLYFEVEDTGPGIAPEDLDSIFEPFVQTQTGRQAQEGTGLGLPISRKFVEILGGHLGVKSQVGQGTIFAFNIPVEQVTASELPSLSPSRRVMALAPGQPRYRILVVDDNPTNRLLVVKLLTPVGFELQEAANGQEAVQIWQDWQPHLIWMDMRMPIMDGYEATRQIKTTTQGQATVIVALTASTHEEEQSIVLSAGCDDFMRKPFKEATLFAVMQKHLGVDYLYDAGAASQELSISDRLLDTEALLAIMPPTWIQALHQAAIDADAEQILSLLQQIPQSQGAIAQTLKHWVAEFRFDQITALTEPATHA
jgi:signal transduction histidine kinase/CheY-like chemotaxis protein